MTRRNERKLFALIALLQTKVGRKLLRRAAKWQGRRLTKLEPWVKGKLKKQPRRRRKLAGTILNRL